MAHLTPAELFYQKEHVTDDMRPAIAVCNGMCLGIALVAVTLRFVSRRIARLPYGTDDWTILVALLSILFFYRHIFPQPWFKRALIGTGAFVLCTGFVFICLTIFQCIPVESQWDPTKAPGARCIDYPSVVFASGLLNALISIFVLVLPLPLIWQLNISTQKKRLIMLTFALGGAECIISIIRLAFVHSFKGADATWGNVPTANLTTVELGIGILCACVPVYRPLYNYVFHHRKPNSSANNSNGISSGSHSGHKPYSGQNIKKGLGGGKRWNSHGNGYLRSEGNDDEDAMQLSPRPPKAANVIMSRERMGASKEPGV
ncbi:MAG: hypothetical protein Q9217_001188 [Psora testacea]